MKDNKKAYRTAFHLENFLSLSIVILGVIEYMTPYTRAKDAMKRIVADEIVLAWSFI
jgi:hypothetical protein